MCFQSDLLNLMLDEISSLVRINTLILHESLAEVVVADIVTKTVMTVLQYFNVFGCEIFNTANNTFARSLGLSSSTLPFSSSSFPAKLARLSLSLPPLALSLPLSPGPKGGLWDGGNHRIGRRRGVSAGSDPEEDEEEEQEDESSRKVIVVTETDVHKRVGLRSLLKSPKEPLDKENRDHGRNVSFFDDVTVYLFDQV